MRAISWPTFNESPSRTSNPTNRPLTSAVIVLSSLSMVPETAIRLLPMVGAARAMPGSETYPFRAANQVPPPIPMTVRTIAALTIGGGPCRPLAPCSLMK